ncbi:MAG: hypothetical protein ACRCSM_06450 [Sediminibacterium sp.]|jgi:hypothetical protein
MKTKTAFFTSFLLFTVIANATSASPTHDIQVRKPLLNNSPKADTTQKPVAQTVALADLKTKMLGIWRDVEGENATFEIKPNSIYYFEHGAAYKISLTRNVISIKFPDYTFTGTVSFVNGTMVINSREFGVSKYKRMK